MSWSPASTRAADERCSVCGQGLIPKSASPEVLHPQLFQIVQRQLLIRCACKRWRPVPFRLKKILLAILHASMHDEAP